MGYGGRVLLAQITRISAKTISTRTREIKRAGNTKPGSLARRRSSGLTGRKLVEVKDPEIIPALDRILVDETAGDPMGHQKWIRCTIRSLSRRLKEQGHPVGHGAVARLLRKMGYSLHVMKKKRAGADHPSRDEQFKYIGRLKSEFLDDGLPIISIDTKKKELIGDYRREGRSWRKQPFEVDSYFASYRQCVAVPFGIYDLTRNLGYVTVGISCNTSQFAAACIEQWWELYGKLAYPNADRMLILADGGGGNGWNLRTWKKDLQERICDVFGLTVTVSHYPPGCSKWNPVEYRLFSQISINMAGRPLRSIDAMLALIRGTTTRTGLKVEAWLDQAVYPKGRKTTDRQLAELAVYAHDVCPKWNYTIWPRVAADRAPSK
jgi:transposase